MSSTASAASAASSPSQHFPPVRLTCPSPPPPHVTFRLCPCRRMNVSITRARTSVFILGHAATLKKDPLWEATLHDADERGCLVKAHSPIGIWFEAASKELATADDAVSLETGESRSTSSIAKSVTVVHKCDSPTASASSAGGKKGGSRKRPAAGGARG